MPLFMDIHQIEGANAPDLARLHEADLAKQDAYGVRYLKYWLQEATGKVFCLVEAPTAEAAGAVHRDAHGFVAERIIEVEPDLADGFFGQAEASSTGLVYVPGRTGDPDPGVRTVFFTDLVGSTALTERLGDRAAMALLAVHDAIVRDALAAWGGSEVKHTGDGIMAAFASAAGAVRAGARVQSELRRSNAERSRDPIQVRIGASAGQPVEHHRDLFGATVQLAARLCAAAGPDQVVVSGSVVDLCADDGLPFEDLGEIALKGFERPVRAYSVAWATIAQ